MKILIIGGTRFVGLLLVEKLAQRGDEVTVFNRGNRAISFPKNVQVVTGDRNNGFSPVEGKFDAVIDMCAYKGEQTAQALKELKFNYFLHMSTAAVYKKSETFPLTEDSPVGSWPLWSEYNEGKVACERELRMFRGKYSVIRPVYILGQNNYVDRERFIYSKLKNKEKIILPGDGQAKVQFVFANELAGQIVKMLDKKVSGAFNSCGDSTVTLVELVRMMAKIVGVKPEIAFNPAADGVNFNEDEFPFANETFYCSNEKAKKLGVKFEDLKKALARDYLEYYSKIV